MVALPELDQKTVNAIFAAYEANEKGYQSEKIGASDIGHECARALWYALRQVTRKKFDGRMLRLFETGNLEEARFVANLRSAGVEVSEVDPATGKQWRFSDSTGHIVCKIDAAMLGVLEAPKTWHVGEFKTHNDESYKNTIKLGLKQAKPEHWWQCQIGMHLTGMKRAFYLMRNKNTDALKSFRLDYDQDSCERMIERAQGIVALKEPPEKISRDPSWFVCKFCDHHAICHGQAPPPRVCRTCMHVTPIDGGAWQCDLFNATLDRERQRSGCGAHAYIPALVHAEQIDAGQHEGGVWVRYRLADGGEWTDGPLPVVAPAEAPRWVDDSNAHAAMAEVVAAQPAIVPSAAQAATGFACVVCDGAWDRETDRCSVCGNEVPF